MYFDARATHVPQANVCHDTAPPARPAIAAERRPWDSQMRERLRTRGLARADGFTWQDCALGTCDVYEQAAVERGVR